LSRQEPGGPGGSGGREKPEDQAPAQAAPRAGLDQTFRELRAHQIELELQNEQLHETQLELETARAKYFDLYELAPVGYVTLDERGRVVEANLTASRLLSAERAAIVGRPFAAFIAPGDQDTYDLFLRDAFSSEWPHTCEVRLLSEADDPGWLRLDATPREVDDTGSKVTRMTLTDVSEAQRASRVIARLLRMRDAAEHVAHTGTWSVDLRTWKTRWSPEMVRLFDLDADAAQDMMQAIEQRVHPADRARVKADLADLAVTRVSGHQEFRVVRRDGTVRVLSGDYAVHHDPGVERAELVGSFKDVTDERRAQEEIARLQAICDTAEEVAGTASWEYDVATRMTTWTRGTERLFDVARGEFAGDLLGLLEARVHPDDATATLAAFRSALERGEALAVEYRIILRDGSEHALTSLARSRLDEAGRPVVVTGWHRDVTEERSAHAEVEHLRTMRNEAERVAGMLSWSVDLDTGAVSWSPGMYQVYDVDEPEGANLAETTVLIAKVIETRVHPDDRSMVRTWIAVARETGEYPPGELRVRHRDGSEHVIRSEARVERDARGVPVRLVGYQQDVTGQRSAEAEILRLREELRHRSQTDAGQQSA
jgi:PAS domain S-box-containing protein